MHQLSKEIRTDTPQTLKMKVDGIEGSREDINIARLRHYYRTIEREEIYS